MASLDLLSLLVAVAGDRHEESLRVPRGFTDDVLVSVGGAAATKSTLERDYSLTLELKLAPKSTTWVSLLAVA